MNKWSMKDKRMNSEVYKVRRIVIEALYEAKAILGRELPRIKVRISENTDKSSTVLGRALLKGNEIKIIGAVSTWTPRDVRHVVWHELAHAWFGAQHDSGCPLMAPVISRKASINDLKKALMTFKNIPARA